MNPRKVVIRIFRRMQTKQEFQDNQRKNDLFTPRLRKK